MYKNFSDKDISDEIARLLKADNINADFNIIYQSVKDLHDACPDHKGDWYFTGDYPTPGGNMIANKSFVYFMEGNVSRAY